jgi:hypothetical protein
MRWLDIPNFDWIVATPISTYAEVSAMKKLVCFGGGFVLFGSN